MGPKTAVVIRGIFLGSIPSDKLSHGFVSEWVATPICGHQIYWDDDYPLVMTNIAIENGYL